MANTRIGDCMEDYEEDLSTLGPELQRILATMRDLDERFQAIINQTRDQTDYCLRVQSTYSKKEYAKMKKDIEANQENALRLSTEKVLLAQQAHDMIERQIKRLDEYLNQFTEDLKQEGKISPDEPAILPLTTQHDTDLELMPPSGSHKNPVLIDADRPTDPIEPIYCVCQQVSFGDMIKCDNEDILLRSPWIICMDLKSLNIKWLLI